jgi:MOSC domain-containing protein YiiM
VGTGIFKKPVDSPVTISLLGLDGDYISNKKHHGGPDQAVYIYGQGDYDWWGFELGKKFSPGTFGENLTVSSLESAAFYIGDRLIIGAVILEVTAPRIPCETFSTRMGDPGFINRFRNAERPGLYCRVLQEGTIRLGEGVTVEPCRDEKVTLIEIFRDYYAKAADVPTLRRFLLAPIASRARRDLEARLEKMLAKG